MLGTILTLVTDDEHKKKITQALLDRTKNIIFFIIMLTLF